MSNNSNNSRNVPLFKDQVRSVDPEEQGRPGDSHAVRDDARSAGTMPTFKDQVRDGAGNGPSSPLRATDFPPPAFKDQVRDSPLQRRLQRAGARGKPHLSPNLKDQLREDDGWPVTTASSPAFKDQVRDGEFQAETNTRRDVVGVGAQAVAGTGNANRDQDVNEEESQSTSSTTANPAAKIIEAELVQRPVDAESVHQIDERRKYLLGSLFSFITLMVIGGVVAGAVCGTGRCSGGSVSNNTSVPAEPPEPCDVDVTLDCQTLDGRNCADIGPPYTASCIDGSGERIRVLGFSYQNETQCNLASNSQGSKAICMDNATLVGGPVDVQCSAYRPYGDLCLCCTRNYELTVSPGTIYPGDVFTLSDPSGLHLPTWIECIISFNGTKIQTNVIDTSGTVSLNLREKFGSLQVESCDDLTCLETVRHIVQISNVGGDPIFISNMNLTTPNVTWSLTDLLQQNSLSPGEATFVERQVEINTCSGLEFSSQVNVGANLTNGEMLCQGSDEFTFKVAPLPPSVANNAPVPAPAPNPPTDSCVISLTADCLFAGDGCFSGLSCSIPYIGAFEPCLPPPDSVVMLFNGGGCEQSDAFATGQLVFSCDDFNGGPPVNFGDQAHILVEDNSTVYYDGVVLVGDLIPSFSTNSGLMQYVTISTPDNRTVLQQMQYHSSCLDLGVRYGPLQLVGRTLIETVGSGTGPATGSFSQEILVPITAFGDDVTLTNLIMQTNFAGLLDLTDQVAGETASPGGNVVVTLEGFINTASRLSYRMNYTVEGIRNSDGKLCAGADLLTFDSGQQY